MRNVVLVFLLGLSLWTTGCSREMVLAAAQGLEQGARAPITTCRTTRAQRGTRIGYYTTCNTYGGY